MKKLRVDYFSNISQVAKALPCLFRLVQRGVQLEELNLDGLASSLHASADVVEGLL